MKGTNETRVGVLARWAAAAGLLLLTAQAGAAVLFEQLPTTGAEAGGYISSMDQGAQNADDFSIGFAATVNTVEWWGGYKEEVLNENGELVGYDPITPEDGSKLTDDSFTIRLVPEVSGSPAADSFTALVGSITKAVDGDLVKFSLALTSPLALAGGQRYYLSIMNDPTAGETWWWSYGVDTEQTPDSWFRGDEGDAWEPGEAGLAFRLIGERVTPAPEPSTIALLGLGILLAGRAARRPRRSR